VKIAYYAVQNVAAVFDDTLARVPDSPIAVECAKPVAWYAFKHVADGRPLVVFWDKSAVPSNENGTTAATFTLPGLTLKEPVWVDIITGGIHEIPPAKIAVEPGKTVLKDLPVYDAPALITERSLVMP